MECGLTDELHHITVPKKETNPKSLKLFYSLIIPYVVAVLYVFINFDLANMKILVDITGFTKFLLVASGSLIFIVGCIATLSTIIYLFFIHKITKAFITIGRVCECLASISSFFLLLRVLVNSYVFQEHLWILTLFCTLCFWKFCVSQFVFSRLGMNLISQVIKESCRAIKECNHIILFTILSTLLAYVVATFTGIVAAYILVTNETFLNGVCLVVTFIYGLWIICFIITFTGLVCCKTFSTWFFTEDKSTFSKYTTIKNIVVVARYHLGTVAYASSLWSVVPLVILVIKNVVKKERDTRYNIFVLISCYLSAFWTLTNNCCIFTATKGKNYKKSIDATSQLYLKYPLQVHAINKALSWCLFFTSLLILVFYSLIFIGIHMLVIKHEKNIDETIKTICLFLLTYVVSIIPGILIILLAVVTITFCIYENYECEKQNNIKTHYTSPKLENLVLKE